MVTVSVVACRGILEKLVSESADLAHNDLHRFSYLGYRVASHSVGLFFGELKEAAGELARGYGVGAGVGVEIAIVCDECERNQFESGKAA
jgi:hypothetical protein